MFGKQKDRVEIRENRWAYFGDDTFIRRSYRTSNGMLEESYGKIRWYNRWFIKLMNRNRVQDTRTVHQMMKDAGIVSISSPDSNIMYVNTELMKNRKG